MTMFYGISLPFLKKIFYYFKPVLTILIVLFTSQNSDSDIQKHHYQHSNRIRKMMNLFPLAKLLLIYAHTST